MFAARESRYELAVARLADLLEAQLDPLLKRWEVSLATRERAASELGRARELADQMPTFIRYLVEALRDDGAPAESAEAGRDHGARRLRVGFDLASVVREYGLLLHLALELVEAAETAVPIADVRRLADLVTSAVADATAEHARRLAESAPVAASAEFEAMFNSLPDGAFLTDATGIRRANQAGLAMLGVETVEALRSPPPELTQWYQARDGATGEGLTKGRSVTERALAGEIVRQEYVVRNISDGRDVRLRTAASPIRVGDRITGAIIVHTDITEQHRALEALHRSEEGFRTLAEAIPQQVWTATPDGGLDFVNQRVLDYFAVPREQVLGAGWQGVIHPDDLPTSVERWTHALETGQDYEVEFRLRRGDGAHRWHLARAIAAHDAGGEVVKWFGTNTDIHEAKRVREELLKRTEFEQHLLGIVSHDLRNPLSAIHMGAAFLLKVEELGERATKVAQRIHSSAERSSRMIADLLDFTQARLGGGLPIDRRPSDLYALTITALEELEVAYPERTIDLTRAGDTRGIWDADRLAQVVGNLVTNALKYSPPASPVDVRIVGHEGVVELAVQNAGPPIPAEQLGRIFEPLHRATDQIDRKTRSVGLGLYIVDAIVRAHGGVMEVVSNAETGTTFTVRLPKDPATGPA